MLTLLFFAFLAGLATSLSPCVLVVLPIIMSSSLQRSRWQPFATIAGLVLSFSFFTLFLGTIVQVTGLSANALRYASIFIVFAFGVALLVPFVDRFVAKAFQPVTQLGTAIDSHGRRVQSPILSGLILGCALGLLWTPCAGPILAAVTSIVATNTLSWTAAALVFLYALGSAVPLLAFAFAGQKLIWATRFLNRHLEAIRRGFGVIMIATSILMLFELDTAFVQSVAKFVPVISVDTSDQVRAELRKLKPANPINQAPDFVGINTWINSEPLTMQSLRGKVVLVDFWTYSCINCVRTFPYLRRWHETYKHDGLVIVGVHTPEFAFEKDEANVRRATQRFGITYPVALDNDYATWDAFSNEAWPAHYLIDRDGIIRMRHLGEGNYQQTEEYIRELLSKEPGAPKVAEPNYASSLTPETYLGFERARAYTHDISRNVSKIYDGSPSPALNKVSLWGEFTVRSEAIEAGLNAKLFLRFNASQVHLVLSGSSTEPIRVSLDEKPYSQFIVDEPKMYDIVDIKGELKEHLLQLEIPQGVAAYAFTFGGSR